MRRILLASAFIATSGMAAWAGPQFIDETGFAVSGYDVVAYFSLPQSEVGQPQPEAIPGRTDITAEHNGSTFAFATEENRDIFLANPAKYTPKFDGHCAYGVSVGGKVPGNPHLWRIVDGDLYLNITEDVVSFWEEDIPGKIVTADGNWQKIEPEPASTITIPFFTSPAPSAN